MKILFITPKSVFSGKSFGGAEKSMFDMAVQMAKREHEVSFLSSQDFIRFGKSMRSTEQGIRVHLLPVIRLPGLSIPTVQKLNYRLRGLIIRRYLSKWFKDVDVIYTYNELPSLYQLSLWKKQNPNLKARIVYRSAGVYWEGVLKKEVKGASDKLKSAFASVDMINFNCDGMRSLFYETYSKYPLNTVFQKELILDIGTNLGEVKEVWRYPKNETFDIVMVARFDNTYKRQDMLIEAFEQWGNKDARLIFLGDGPAMEKLESYCRSNEFLCERVVFKGFVSKDIILNHLVNCSCASLCTISEGMSKAIAESMATGTPLLASNVMAINTYIEHGHNGFLVDNTVEDWRLALDGLHKASKDEMEVVSRNAREYAVKSLDSKTNTKMFLKEFEELLSEK